MFPVCGVFSLVHGVARALVFSFFAQRSDGERDIEVYSGYFNDPWNWLDFIIVVFSLVSIAAISLSSLRVFRVFRPLRTLSHFPSAC